MSYFSRARELLRSGTKLQLDFSEISSITPDAIALLLALVQDRDFRRGTPVAGVAPLDQLAASMFEASGFYDHVYTARESKTSSTSNLILHVVTENRVEPAEAKKAGRVAVAHLFGDGRIVRPPYEVLIEAMANTNNHANPLKLGVFDWWLFVYNDPTARRTVFTFIDLGIGIFKSLPKKKHWRKVLIALGLTDNAAIARQLIAGEIASRTSLKERGKGIPLIAKHAMSGTFSKFVMISNDVFSDLVARTHRKLRFPFHGTLFSFEMLGEEKQ
jgi:hypothetical protein